MITDYTLFSVAMPPPNTKFKAVFNDESGYYHDNFYCDHDGRFFMQTEDGDKEIEDFKDLIAGIGLIGWVKDD